MPVGKVMSTTNLLITARHVLAKLIEPKETTAMTTVSTEVLLVRKVSAGVRCNDLDVLSLKDIPAKLDHLDRLWHSYNKRLEALELKEATQGLNADPAVRMEIDELVMLMKKTLARYQELRALQSLPSEEAA
jgi:hypothetical protein